MTSNDTVIRRRRTPLMASERVVRQTLLDAEEAIERACVLCECVGERAGSVSIKRRAELDAWVPREARALGAMLADFNERVHAVAHYTLTHITGDVYVAHRAREHADGICITALAGCVTLTESASGRRVVFAGVRDAEEARRIMNALAIEHEG